MVIMQKSFMYLKVLIFILIMEKNDLSYKNN